jgi:hypothetical protein
MRLHHKIATAAIACFLSVSLTSAAIPTGYLGVPFCCDTLKHHYQQIPGQVACVFFDSGGEGVAFHYAGGCGDGGTTIRKNAGGTTIQADVALCMQPYETAFDYVFGTNPGQHAVGYWHLAWIGAASPTDPGEWVKFSVHVNTAGMYYVTFHEANAYLPNLQLLTYYDGQNVKVDSIANMPVDTPLPSGCPEVWHSWSTTLVDSVVLDTGLQVIQLTFKVGSWNMDIMQFDLHAPLNVMHAGMAVPEESGIIKVSPMENSLKISFGLAQAGKASFSVMDSRGRLVGNRVTKFLASGTQSQSLPLGALCPGVYFLGMEHNGVLAQSRFIVTR